MGTFSYDICKIVPWICLFLSVSCSKAATYYIKTFASTAFYGNISNTKHEKNRVVLKMAAITSLLIGLCVGVGNEAYFESVKYAKRWFMKYEQYSIESYQSKKKVQEMMKENLNTPGFDEKEEVEQRKNVNTTEEDESDQIEGGGPNTLKTKYTAFQNKILHGNYQQESEMLLTSKYFHQGAHDLFEYMSEICVCLEDKFLNSLMIPSYSIH